MHSAPAQTHLNPLALPRSLKTGFPNRGTPHVRRDSKPYSPGGTENPVGCRHGRPGAEHRRAAAHQGAATPGPAPAVYARTAATAAPARVPVAALAGRADGMD